MVRILVVFKVFFWEMAQLIVSAVVVDLRGGATVAVALIKFFLFAAATMVPSRANVQRPDLSKARRYGKLLGPACHTKQRCGRPYPESGTCPPLIFRKGQAREPKQRKMRKPNVCTTKP